MNKCFFIEESPALYKVEIDDQFFVEILPAISWEDYLQMLKVKSDVTFLQKIVKSWNFTDSKGEDVECNKESIEKLTSNVVMPIINAAVSLYSPEKKS